MHTSRVSWSPATLCLIASPSSAELSGQESSTAILKKSFAAAVLASPSPASSDSKTSAGAPWGPIQEKNNPDEKTTNPDKNPDEDPAKNPGDSTKKKGPFQLPGRNSIALPKIQLSCKNPKIQLSCKTLVIRNPKIQPSLELSFQPRFR